MRLAGCVIPILMTSDKRSNGRRVEIESNSIRSRTSGLGARLTPSNPCSDPAGTRASHSGKGIRPKLLPCTEKVSFYTENTQLRPSVLGVTGGPTPAGA